MIPIERADVIVKRLMPLLEIHASKIMVCGSIRRKKRFINDIDIVMIQKKDYAFGDLTLAQTISGIDPDGLSQATALGPSRLSRFSDGNDIKRFMFQGVMIDLYLATEKNFSCLVLIRTGSMLHNKKLTRLAIEKELRLFASGDGLCTWKMVGDKPIPVKVIESTEDGILKYLLGFVPKPEEREV